MRLSLAVLFAFLFPVPGTSQAVDVPQCRDCEIAVSHLVTLGETSGEAYLDSPPGGGILTDSGWVVVLLTEYATPAVFDTTGEFIKRLGAFGPGSKQFKAASSITRSERGFTIIDSGNRRISFLSEELEVDSVFSLPFGGGSDHILLASGDLLISANINSASRAGLPYHFVALEHGIGRVARSFSTSDGSYNGEAIELARLLSEAQEGGSRYWSAEIASYRIKLMSGDTVVRAFDRTPDWFPGPSSAVIGSPRNPPSPRLTDVRETPEGFLWVLGLAPDPDWEAAWEAVMPMIEDRIEIRMSEAPPIEDLWDTIVEVLDAETGELIARTRMDAVGIQFLADGLILATKRDGTTPKADVWRMRLVNHSMN